MINSINNFLIICILLVSCSTLQETNHNEIPLLLEGKITTTEYQIPVSAFLRFYVKQKLICETQSDNKGNYQAKIPAKYINKDLVKDTIYDNIIQVATHCNNIKELISDTHFLVLQNSLLIKNLVVNSCNKGIMTFDKPYRIY